MHTSQALAVLLHDLAAAGVTDLVGEVPGQILAPQSTPAPKTPTAPAVPKVEVVQPKPAPRAATPRSLAAVLPEAAPVLDWAAHIRIFPSPSPLWLAVVHEGPLPPENPPLQGEAAILVQNMLKAIGWQNQPVGWVVLHGALASGGPLNHVNAAQSWLLEQLKEHEFQGIIAFGQRPMNVLLGANIPLADWRTGAAPAYPGTAWVGATYAPEALLAQPMLKRQAWADLLSFAAKVRTILAGMKEVF